MIRLFKYFASVFFVLISLIACSFDEDEKYSRSDCIVEVELDWMVSGVDKVKAINLLSDLIDAAESLGYRGPYPAGYKYQKDDTHLYLQYYSECNQRIGNTESLLVSVINSELHSKLKFEVSESKIRASIDTVMIEGPAWLD